MEVTRRGLFGDGIKLLLAATLGGVLGNEFLRGVTVQALSASYPTSVVQWTDVAPGDLIKAGHINQLYAEIKAIEGDILNGGMKLKSTVTVEG
jgi:hypothetical protein